MVERQITQGSECPGKEFGFYLKYEGKPLRSLEQEAIQSDLYFPRVSLARVRKTDHRSIKVHFWRPVWKLQQQFKR